MGRNTLVKSLLAAACALALAGGAAYAQSRDFDVPAGDLKAALDAYARQSGVQLIYRVEDVRGVRTQGASGALPTEEALARILTGTGFSISRDASGAIAVVSGASQGRTEGGARTTTAPPSQPARNSPETTSQDRPITPASPAETETSQMETILVTGTHIRGVNPTAPLIVLDKEDIDSTGLTTTTQLIESLPQNFSLVNQSATGGALSGNSASVVQGASINLRGMGEGTTLTLVNGRRLPLGYDGSAVNIVALPLSAIDRVEVLTDGASAIYGSDAVGGVVNFILHQDFEGAEARARFGFADSLDEHRLSQTLGQSWDGGNLVVSAERYRRDPLLASDRDFGAGDLRTRVGTLLPEEDNYALAFFGRQDLSRSVGVFADVLYTKRDSFNKSSEIVPTGNRDLFIDNTQLSLATGLDWRFGSDWRAELSGGYGKDDLQYDYYDPPAPLPRGDIPIVFKVVGADFKADGPLFDLSSGKVRLAVGAHWRKESHDFEQTLFTAQGAVGNNSAFERTRQVKSVFGEAFVPLLGGEAGAGRLELSFAGRYDDYSDFGSSFDPRIGLAWQPVKGLRLRGAWGSSYLAPKLKDFDIAFNSTVAYPQYVVANGLTILSVGGNAPESLKAQESENYTLGVDWNPEFLPGASLSLNYYRIDYSGKIEAISTPIPLILANPAAFSDLVILNPTLEQINEYIGYGLQGQGFFPLTPGLNAIDPDFDISTVEAIFDRRRRNIGVVTTRGIDLSVAYSFPAFGGDMRVALDGAYIFELLKQVTATSEPFETRDTFANPTRFRLRGHAGYYRGGFTFNAFVNRRNAYTDNRFLPFAPVGSYTTIDANIAYRFGRDAGLLSDATIALGAVNLFDRDPPGTRVRPEVGRFELGFDPANASPLGRLVTIDLTKRF